jgi:nicotinamidase-related amidase
MRRGALGQAGDSWLSRLTIMTTALLIIDVQRALCTGDEAAFDIGAIIERINTLSAQARSAGLPVVFVQHDEDGGSLEHGSAGWQLADGLLAHPDDLRIRKQVPNSFEQTPLHRWLQERGVTNIVACGLQTDCCVNATVRGALALGYNVDLVGDAHSTVDNAGQKASQIIAQHNEALGGLTHMGPRMRVRPTADVRLGA